MGCAGAAPPVSIAQGEGVRGQAQRQGVSGWVPVGTAPALPTPHASPLARCARSRARLLATALLQPTTAELAVGSASLLARWVRLVGRIRTVPVGSLAKSYRHPQLGCALPRFRRQRPPCPQQEPPLPAQPPHSLHQPHPQLPRLTTPQVLLPRPLPLPNLLPCPPACPPPFPPPYPHPPRPHNRPGPRPLRRQTCPLPCLQQPSLPRGLPRGSAGPTPRARRAPEPKAANGNHSPGRGRGAELCASSPTLCAYTRGTRTCAPPRRRRKHPHGPPQQRPRRCRLLRRPLPPPLCPRPHPLPHLPPAPPPCRPASPPRCPLPPRLRGLRALLAGRPRLPPCPLLYLRCSPPQPRQALHHPPLPPHPLTHPPHRQHASPLPCPPCCPPPSPPRCQHKYPLPPRPLHRLRARPGLHLPAPLPKLPLCLLLRLPCPLLCLPATPCAPPARQTPPAVCAVWLGAVCAEGRGVAAGACQALLAACR
mmetsp:Transcript_12793/g.24680  ORF Transcript_12793/g.24680 Transcript_12793/m.24680 type:complete len:480 (+) Transcript_12793:595-2034(+)